MIVRVEALHYRCLRYIRQDLNRFQVLVGPNASGKTTFMDAIEFLGRIVSDGLESVIGERSDNLRDLVWRREGDRFELAINLDIPKERRITSSQMEFERCRYEIAIGMDAETHENVILDEQVMILAFPDRSPVSRTARMRFPEAVPAPDTILTSQPSRGIRPVIRKWSDGSTRFNIETHVGMVNSFTFDRRKSALANLPEDESKFPVSTWLKKTLIDGVQSLVLNSVFMRHPSPPGKRRGFRTDGSNLPWVIEDLSKKAPERMREWIAHLRTALPDLESIRTLERPEDRHRYIIIRYRDGLEVPSWVVSDGTLRLLALTLPAYLPDLRGVYLIEEPENGIHPRAVETLFQSLSSVYNAQILLATHSPVILSLADPEQVLCFARTQEGATDIVRGSEHPALRDWQGETNLGVLYAAGVLG